MALAVAPVGTVATAGMLLPPLVGWRLVTFVFLVITASTTATALRTSSVRRSRRGGADGPVVQGPPGVLGGLPALVDGGAVLDTLGVPLVVYATDGTCLLANASARRTLHSVSGRASAGTGSTPAGGPGLAGGAGAFGVGPGALGPDPFVVGPGARPGARLLEPDGVTPVSDERRPFVRSVSGEPVDAELVLAPDDAPPRRLLIQSRPVLDPLGAVAAVAVTAVDITDLHEQHRLASWQSQQLAVIADATRAVLREQDARSAICRAAVAVSGAGIAVLYEPGGDGRLTATADHGGDLVGLEVSMDVPSMLAEAFLSARTLTVSDVARDSRVNHALLDAWTRPPALRIAAAAWVPVLNRGRCVGVLATGFAEPVNDWTTHIQALEILAGETAVAVERQDHLRRLAAEAWTDGLTGAANRRAWDATLAQQLEQARCDGRPLAVVLLDFDHFKRFNDEHGHLAGDDLLRSTVRAWQQRLRPGDLLCRWGGEEFAVLLPACPLHSAERLAADLRDLVGEGGTVSAGVAAWNGVERAESLVARADAALYAAKAAGRNRVVADATQ